MYGYVKSVALNESTKIKKSSVFIHSILNVNFPSVNTNAMTNINDSSDIWQWSNGLMRYGCGIELSITYL